MTASAIANDTELPKAIFYCPSRAQGEVYTVTASEEDTLLDSERITWATKRSAWLTRT